MGEDVRVISAPYSTFVISLNSRRMWLPTRVNSGEEVKGFMSLDASLVKNSSWMIQGLVGLWFTPARGAGQDTLSVQRRTVLRGVYYYVVYNIGVWTGCRIVILLLLA